MFCVINYMCIRECRGDSRLGTKKKKKKKNACMHWHKESDMGGGGKRSLGAKVDRRSDSNHDEIENGEG